MAANAQHNILWADDEIDLLKPHLMFLKNKGYNVTTANNGSDALEMASAQPFDLIILDENMPGLTGLETREAGHVLVENDEVEWLCRSHLERVTAVIGRGDVITLVFQEHQVGFEQIDLIVGPENIMLSVCCHIITFLYPTKVIKMHNAQFTMHNY